MNNDNIDVMIGCNHNKYSSNAIYNITSLLHSENTAIFLYHSSINFRLILFLGYIFLIGGGATQINR